MQRQRGSIHFVTLLFSWQQTSLDVRWAHASVVLTEISYKLQGSVMLGQRSHLVAVNVTGFVAIDT